MIYSHSALSLHQWEDMEAERIQSYFEIKLEKKTCLCLDALYCSGFTTFIRWFYFSLSSTAAVSLLRQ